VWVQNPIRLRVVRSMPQPDVVLVQSRADFYATGKPVPDDVLLLIEVMDTSAETDRHVKLPLYARAGIGEVWLLDLTTDRVDIFRQPTVDGYRQAITLERRDRLTPEAFPDFSLTVADLLG
jgi:Uma2 family endonuclease